MQATYDVAVVLGLRFGNRWGLRQDLKDRLDEVIQLYKQHRVRKILVSGKWTIWFDWLRVRPPFTEAALMRKYLTAHGIPKHDILIESRSKDTIGNVYYVKLFMKKYPEFHSLLVVCAAQHEARVRYLFHVFFGSQYQIVFFPILAHHFSDSALGSETTFLHVAKDLLKDVRPGHDEDIQMRLYAEPYYRRQAVAMERALASGKQLTLTEALERWSKE